MERNDDAWIRTPPNHLPIPPSGPDYLALVIEWDDEPLGDRDTIETLPLTRPELPTRGSRVLRGLAISLGALGALAVAGWGVHKLRDA